MSARKRIKRPMTERIEPARSWSGAPQTPTKRRPRSEKAATEGEHRDERWAAARDASYEAVNGGYRVIDEYMRQGQRLAEEFWLPSSESTAGKVPDFSRMMERFLKSAGDMGTAWLEMMTERERPSSGNAGPRGTAGPFTAGTASGRGESARAASGASDGMTLSVAVESSKRVRVSVSAADRLNQVEVHPLVSANHKLPPITTTAIELDAESNHAVLRIAIPDAQPRGTYHGILLDKASQRPAGTVTLVVL